MADFTVLSDADVATLKEFIARVRNQVVSPQRRPYVEQVSDMQSTEVMVALTPDSGLSALTEYTPGGGVECPTFVFRDSGDSVLEDVGLYKVVFNLSTYEVPGNTWVLIAKDKFGIWYVTSRFDVNPDSVTPGTGTGTADTGTSGSGTYGTSTVGSGTYGTSTGTGTTAGTGTGVGTGTTSCQPIVLDEESVACEFGVLNVYTRTVTIDIVDGCLTKEVGEWILDRSEGCCECVGTGTGSGTSTGTVGTGTGTSTSTGSTGTTLVYTTCCGNGIASTLWCTLSNVSNFACVDMTVALVWDGSVWTYTGPMGSCGVDVTITLQCEFMGWVLLLDFGLTQCIVNAPGGESWTGTPSVMCTPFSATATVNAVDNLCGSTGSTATFSIAISA